MIKYLLLLILAACATPVIRPYEQPLLAGKMKFCFIGDMGLDNDVQAKVSALLREEKCHSIHMLGDLIYPKGIQTPQDPELEKKFLKHYAPLTQEGHFPKLNLVLGNHDHDGSAEAWQDLGRGHSFINFPALYYLQNWGGLCLVHLDSEILRKLRNSFKARAQTQWLTSQEEYLRNSCQVKIALAHHPYVSPGPKHAVTNAKIKAFYEEHVLGKFDYLITGHEHVLAEAGAIKGTRLFISGAGGNFSVGQPVGFLVFHVSTEPGKAISIEPQWRKLTSQL